MALVQEAIAEPPPAVKAVPRLPRHRLIREEFNAAGLRNAVAEARQKLFELDREVTGLTRELKVSRGRLWNLQQDHSLGEKSISQFIASHSSDLSSEALEEEKELDQEQQRLRLLLNEAKAKAARWYQDARHQDQILQQERDAQKGGDAHRILARHPAGEVFLPAYPSDNDSDDGDEYYDARRGAPPRGAQPPARRTSDSSEEDDDEYARGQPGAGPRQGGAGQAGPGAGAGRAPPQYSASYDVDSDGSSLPSPSGESGSVSAMLEQSGEAAINAMQPPSSGPVVTKVASSSDSESEREGLPRSGVGGGQAATAKEAPGKSTKPAGSSSGPVPTLPLATAGLTGGGPAVGVGGAAGAEISNRSKSSEVEEVEESYSEDIEEDEDMETSRSC